MYCLPTGVTVSLADSGSNLSELEGASIEVCVIISQDAPDGRECPIDITLTYASSDDKSGEYKCRRCKQYKL